MAELEMLHVGCTSDHGGQIITGDPSMLINGKPVARIGDLHSCPQFYGGASPIPHAITPIIMTAKIPERPMVNGRYIAFETDISGCGAVLLKCNTGVKGLAILGFAAIAALGFLFLKRNTTEQRGMPSPKESAKIIESQTNSIKELINRNLGSSSVPQTPPEQKPSSSENCNCN